MTNYLALYYPFIHFRDESWLKLTSLYWDRMGRIVPADYGLRDRYTVREFQDGGYVVDYRPTGGALVAAANTFREVIAVHADRLARRYGLHLSESWPDDPTTAHSRAARHGNPKLAYVYGPKVSDDLIEEMEATGLAERGGRRDPYWIGMHPKLAAVYMTCLADKMAARRDAQPVSDDILSHIGIGDASVRGMAEALLDDEERHRTRSTREAEAIMADMAIETVVPAQLDEVSPRKLLDFRNRYASERAAFQDEVRSMVATLDLARIEEPQALYDHLQVQYEKRLRPQILDLRRRLRSTGIDTVKSIFNIKTNPAGIAGAASLALLSAPKPVIGAGGLALSFWGVFREHQEARRRVLADHPAASYLYQIDANLSAKGVAGRVAQLSRRFA